MSQCFRAKLLLIAYFFLFPASLAFAEEITDFTARIEIDTDGSFTVSEVINYDFGELERHGVFRYIPTTHPQEATVWYKSRYTEIEVLEVMRDGAPEPFEESQQHDQVYLRIGDPDRTISGSHTYSIGYIVRGGLSYFDDGKTEIYWNVTGNEWEVPIHLARAQISNVGGLLATARACYAGTARSTVACDVIASQSSGVVFTENGLLPGEGLTIGHELDSSKVRRMVLERLPTLWLWLFGILAWFLVLGIFMYRFKTEYKTGRTIVAQYEPLQDIKPMYTGVLFDGRLDSKDVTAGIVYLAEQGFLKITKTESKVFFFFDVDDYEIKLLKAFPLVENEFLKEILRLLFGNNPKTGDHITLNSLKKSTWRQKENQIILNKLKKTVSKDLEKRGFFQVVIPMQYLIVGIILLVASSLFFVDLVTTQRFIKLMPLVIILVGSIVILALFLYRRRTRKGYEALDHLRGFKQYLSVTDKERFAFHNAPEKNPQQFLEYLPYAIAFGVEDKWAEVFKDVTIPNPQWYDAGTTRASFSATNLTTSLGAFSTAFASSSGSSGSGGGGSVGGGGGGGGGGSW